MRNLFTLGLTTALLAAPYAHAQQAATVSDIVVVGADDLLSNYLRVALTAQPGDLLSSINPRAVELEALGTGFFRSAAAELRTVDGKDILQITVVPNPPIGTVTVAGATYIDPAELSAALDRRLNIAPGAILNTVRIQESEDLIAQGYRSAGFPFAPAVSSNVVIDGGAANITYTVTETAPVARVEVSGATVLPADVISAAFQPLVDARTFNVDQYQRAIARIGQEYAQRGYQGSGVNIAATTLQDGVLTAQVNEIRVGTVDTAALGTNIPAPGVSTGELLNLNDIAQDLRALSNATGRAVGITYRQDPADPATVNLAFVPSEMATGPVSEIVIAGNTAVPAEDIRAVLRIQPGDVYTPQLAQEDYIAIRRLYNQRGLDISTRDPIRFENGVLTYNVREVRIGGTEIRYEGEQRTNPRVITRELLPPGSVFNRAELNRRLQAVQRTGVVVPVAEEFRPDPNDPESLTYILTVREQSTGLFSPGIQYDTLNGWAGDVSLQGNNLFGLAHGYNVSVQAQRNDAGQVLSASASYTVPWLDIDFLDFRTNRTSVTAGAYSNVTGNNPVISPDAQTTGYEYTTRNTGLTVGAERFFTPNLSAGLSVNTEYNSYFLEPLEEGATPTVTPEQAADLAPDNGFTTFFNAKTLYSTVLYPDFPTNGYRATASAGYGFGNAGADRLSWSQVQTGARTYFGLGNTLEDGNRQQAIAVRVDAGTIFGDAPINRQFVIGGSDPGERTTLRGFNPGSIVGRNFFTASAEYRYDFNINTSFARGLYGVAFVDFGDAWTNPADLNVNYSYGVGAQVNLGFGTTVLPALRFDYAFSPVNPRGKLHFRIGAFF